MTVFVFFFKHLHVS